MLLKLPIMLLSTTPKSSLLCSKSCPAIEIMLSANVNLASYYVASMKLKFLLIFYIIRYT